MNRSWHSSRNFPQKEEGGWTTCPSCHFLVSPDATTCSVCGAALPSPGAIGAFVAPGQAAGPDASPSLSFTAPQPAPTGPNQRWGMDFIHDARTDGRRFRWLTLFVILVFFGIAGRVVQLQLIHSADYQAIAKENIVRKVTLATTRGVIRDIDGEVLAASRPAYDVFVVPHRITCAEASPSPASCDTARRRGSISGGVSGSLNTTSNAITDTSRSVSRSTRRAIRLRRQGQRPSSSTLFASMATIAIGARGGSAPRTRKRQS